MVIVVGPISRPALLVDSNVELCCTSRSPYPLVAAEVVSILIHVRRGSQNYACITVTYVIPTQEVLR